MKYAIIIGSHRAKSQSSKVGKVVAQYIKQVDKTAKTYTLDLRKNPLPLWDESAWDPKGKLTKIWKPYSKNLVQADAFVIISPEWSGMVPAGLKNFFLLCGNGELAYKPAMIVTVSASRGGAYPVAELRMSSYKNTYISYIPEHIIVRNVEKVFNDSKLNEEDKEDFYLKKRTLYGLKILKEHGNAFQKIRKSGILDFKTYPFGM